MAALEKQLQIAQIQEVRLQKCLEALKEAQGMFVQLSGLSNEAKKQAGNTMDKAAKFKLVEISNKLKTIAQTFPHRFEYLITEIEDISLPELLSKCSAS